MEQQQQRQKAQRLTEKISVDWTPFERDLFNLITKYNGIWRGKKFMFSSRTAITDAMLLAYDEVSEKLAVRAFDVGEKELQGEMEFKVQSVRY